MSVDNLPHLSIEKLRIIIILNFAKLIDYISGRATYEIPTSQEPVKLNYIL